MPRHQGSARAFLSGIALCCTLAGAAPLAGCASFSPDGGMEAVNAVVTPALGATVEKVSADDAAAAQARVGQLLKSTVSPDAAVQVALLNNKGLQAAYNQLGIAEATMVESSLPPSPTFSISGVSTPVELDIEARIVADILALATLPARAQIAADRFREAQLQAAEETLRLAAQTRRSYYRAVAAHERVTALRQAVTAAQATAKLAKELAATGAMNKLDQAREDAFQADITIELAKAREQAASEREHLVRAMGLSGSEPLKLPGALPALPRRPRDEIAAERESLQRRVDLQIARIEVEALAKSYGLTKATRFVDLLEVSGVSRTQRDPGGPHGTGGGAEADFQVPIFDFGEVRLRQAGEAYMAAVNRLSEKAVEVASQAREAYQAYRSNYGIADQYRKEVLPLRKTIADETMLRYGAMQIDVFSLLTEAQRRIAADIAAINAQKDFWLATVDLDAAVIGGGVVKSDSVASTSANSDATAGE